MRHSLIQTLIHLESILKYFFWVISANIVSGDKLRKVEACQGSAQFEHWILWNTADNWRDCSHAIVEVSFLDSLMAKGTKCLLALILQLGFHPGALELKS